MASFSTNTEKYDAARETKALVSKLLSHAQEGEDSKLRQTLKDYVAKHNQPGEESVSEKDVLAHTKDGNGRTVLHFAASKGRENIVKVVLEICGVDPSVVNARDAKGVTPVALALITGHQDVAQQLVSAGADVNIPDSDGVCCVHRAAGHGDILALDVLHAAGANLELQSGAGTPLHWAAGEGRASIVEHLLRLGASPNAKSKHGATAILMAAARGAGRVCVTLVDAGADLTAELPGGLTALHVMAEVGLATAVDAVLKREEGPGLAAKEDAEKRLPFDLAVGEGMTECVELLLPHSPPYEGMSVTEATAESRKRHPSLGKGAAQGPMGGGGASAVGDTAGSDVHALESTDAAKSPADAEESLRLKGQGNAFLQAGQLEEAVRVYGEALLKDGSNHALWSNRSAAYLGLKKPHDALADAQVCRQLKPDWVKACYRMAAARLALGRYEEAAMSAWEGVQLDDSNEEMKNLLRKCVKLGKKEHQQKQKQGDIRAR